MRFLSFKNTHKGFTLIELMIAMVIGLFLLAGIATSYVSSKKASVNRSQSSLLEDNGRLALEVITNSLEHTGYAPNLLLDRPFIQATSDVIADTCPDGSVNVVNTGILKVVADNDTDVQDTIGVVFHGDDDIFTDCAGNVLAASTPASVGPPVVPGVLRCRLQPLPQVNTAPESSKIYNSFYVNDTTKTLECAGSRTAAPVTIADGVENIQFLYGVDTNTDGIVDRYTNATAINDSTTDDLDWGGVIAIQTAILVRSLQPVKAKSESKKYTLLDQVVTSPDDKHQRAVFSSTIYLQNAL